IEQQLAAVRARVANRPRPKTLLIFGREPGSLRGLDASGGVGFLHDMLDAAGGVDVLADMARQSVTMTTEMVLARTPDVIVELRYARRATADADDTAAWDALPAVPAVRNHRIVVLQGE